MIKKALLLAISIQNVIGIVSAEKPNQMLFNATQPNHIFVNNRILAKVNEKPISTIDVMKKMDLLFYRQFPQYASSVEARYQFYNMNWKPVLEEMVEKELVLADADAVKMEVSNGDVRQEIETYFGPNIIANLDKAGLTYDEASKMVKEDLMIRRMMMARVNAKAVRAVTPADIRREYDAFAVSDAAPDQWRYQVVSIRAKDAVEGAEAATRAYRLLAEENIATDQLLEKLKEESLMDEGTTFSISDEFVHNGKQVSEEYKTTLSSLGSGTFSQPIAQQSRATGEMVFRIFYLKELIPGGAPDFSLVEIKIKNMLVDKEIQKETERYISKLKGHYDIQTGEKYNMYSEDYQPFVLR